MKEFAESSNRLVCPVSENWTSYRTGLITGRFGDLKNMYQLFLLLIPIFFCISVAEGTDHPELDVPFLLGICGKLHLSASPPIRSMSSSGVLPAFILISSSWYILHH